MVNITTITSFIAVVYNILIIYLFSAKLVSFTKKDLKIITGLTEILKKNGRQIRP